MQELNQYNFSREFGSFLDCHQIPTRSAAQVIGCSEITMKRLLNNIEPPTLPTDEMLKQAGCMMVLGYTRYSKLSRAEKKNLSDAIGPIFTGSIGFAAITSVVSVLGVAGLSAAGISSGLAAMGGVIGGGMAAGVTVAAALPIAFAGVGFGIVKAVKYIKDKNSLNATNLDLYWEIIRGD